MKITLVTPLYPPDIGEFANYSKELAKRLSPRHKVTIITYGDYPEEVVGVEVISVSKQKPVLTRLIVFTHTLWKNSRQCNIIYSQNGASIELPLIIVGLILSKPIIVRLGDMRAYQKSIQSKFLGHLINLLLRRARVIIVDSLNDLSSQVKILNEKIEVIPKPNQKPKILPFETRPETALSQYEESWSAHIENLDNLFKKYV